MQFVVFVIAAVIIIAGALGVIGLSNPVHSALSLVATLFGVAVLFVAQDAQFLAAVQVIVYAGAIVVLFLFVIMLLGVDRADDLTVEPLVGQRSAAFLSAGVILALLSASIWHASDRVTGQTSVLAPPTSDSPNIVQLAKLLFTDYVFAFEATAILLTIAVVGAVVLAKRRSVDDDARPVSEASPEVEPAEVAS